MVDPILSEPDEVVLRWLVDHGGDDARKIAIGTGLSLTEALFALANLQEIGYVNKRPVGCDR